jgi:hypothetical protein
MNHKLILYFSSIILFGFLLAAAGATARQTQIRIE